MLFLKVTDQLCAQLHKWDQLGCTVQVSQELKPEVELKDLHGTQCLDDTAMRFSDAIFAEHRSLESDAHKVSSTRAKNLSRDGEYETEHGCGAAKSFAVGQLHKLPTMRLISRAQLIKVAKDHEGETSLWQLVQGCQPYVGTMDRIVVDNESKNKNEKTNNQSKVNNSIEPKNGNKPEIEGSLPGAASPIKPLSGIERRREFKARPKTAEYHALMENLREQQQEKEYRQLIGQPTDGSTTLPSIGQEAKVVKEQLTTVFNILISAASVVAALWYWTKTGNWKDSTRTLLCIFGGLLTLVAEVVVYLGYIRRVNEARLTEQQLKEVSYVVSSEVIGAPSNVPHPSHPANVRRRNHKS